MHFVGKLLSKCIWISNIIKRRSERNNIRSFRPVALQWAYFEVSTRQIAVLKLSKFEMKEKSDIKVGSY